MNIEHSGWFSNLPNEWSAIPIKYGFQLIGSGTTPPSEKREYYGGNIPWVNTSELRENIILATEKTVTTEAIIEFSSLKTYPINTVLFAMYGATIGRVAILGVPATVNQAVCALSNPSNFTPRFVFYGLQASREYLATLASGGGQPNLNAEKVREHKLPCPPLETQRRIADYLDSETTQIDTLIAEKERMLALLAEKRAALVSRAVTRGLDPAAPLKPSGLEWLEEIPAHWAVMQLKRTWLSADYGISEDIRGEGPIKILRMSCIIDEKIDISNAGAVEEVNPNLFLHIGDLLFNRTNSMDQIAKVGLLDYEPESPISFASYLVRIRVNELASSEYLVALLNSHLFLSYARSNAIPAIGQANLNPTRYGELLIPLPPRKEQGTIVTYLAAERSRNAKLEFELRSSVALLKERRSALITAAVTGQLDQEVLAA